MRNTPAGASADDEQSLCEENKRHPRHQADAQVLLAEAFLRDSKVASTTDERYQVVLHVDSAVLSGDTAMQKHWVELRDSYANEDARLEPAVFQLANDNWLEHGVR